MRATDSHTRAGGGGTSTTGGGPGATGSGANATGTMAAALAQILAQTLTSLALVAHATAWPDVSIWVAVPLVAAIAVPFRHDGSARDRAAGNFGAAVVASGILWWEALLGGLDGLLGGGGPILRPVALLLLVSTVLFALAGGLFWLRREERP